MHACALGGSPLRTGRRMLAALLQASLLLLSCLAPAAASDAPAVASQAGVLDFMARHSCAPPDPHEAILLAQAAPASPDQNSPAPNQNPPSASPFLSPTPAPAPTLMPVRGGPGMLIPPTPYATGPTVTPPPIPTPSPAFTASPGPIYLIRPTGTPPAIMPAGASPPSPAQSPTATPSAVPTLGPNQFALLADTLNGSTAPGVPGDAIGNVHLYFGEGIIVGDRGHYDGSRTITLSGHPYVINRAQNTILHAETITFDTVTQKATLVGGHGSTIEGIEHGELYYTAQTLTSTHSELHGDHASFSTCLNPHRGYHIEARTITMTENRLIARRAVVFLGPTAIFFLPLLIIPLGENVSFHRRGALVPQLGYDQNDGFYVRAQIGFGTSAAYNGYYRVDYFTKRGLGLGYVATIAPRNNRRVIQVDSYSISDRTTNARQSNLNLTDTENFSSNFRGNLGANYDSNFGPYITLPASLNLTGNLTAAGTRSSENLTFNRSTQGTLSDQTSLAYTQQQQLSQNLRQAFSLAYSQTSTSSSGTSIKDDTLHINTQTSYTTKYADYLFTVNKTDASQPQEVGYDTVPELQINPHINFHSFRFPFQTQFTYGYYTEPQNAFSTERADMLLNWPVYFKVFHTSDFSATLNVHQDLYGTGDAKASVQQTAALTTPLGNHIVNAITYNDSYPIGPPDVPFLLLDRLASASKQAQDTLRFFNGDVYALSLATGTGFNRQAEPVSYQLSLRPSRRSYFILGGSWVPGSGNGFATTNVQMITPLGHDADLQFTTNVDWKNKGRLEDKNLYYRITIGDCYQLLASYNQDVKQFNLGVNLLAFPSHTASFGIGGQTGGGLGSILPQSLTY